MKGNSCIFYISPSELADILTQMPPKRLNEGGHGQPAKRAKSGQASGPTPKTASVPQKKGKCRFETPVVYFRFPGSLLTLWNSNQVYEDEL